MTGFPISDDKTHQLLTEILESVRNGNRIGNLILQELQAATGFLSQIELNTRPHQFTLKGVSLMANPIPAGSTGQIGWTLQDNGAPVTPAPNLTLTLSSPDPLVTFAPATTDASGGTIPLANQTVITVGASDTQTSAVINASAPAPDDSTATGSITVAVTPTPQKFTLVGTQLLP